MNLLIENAPDFIEVGGKKLTIKTDFTIWVKFLIAIEENNGKMAVEVLKDIFGELPTNLELNELIKPIMNWLYPASNKMNIKAGNKTTSKAAFDFSVDGNVIFCELWEHFPHLMKQGISFQVGLELIKLLISNENTTMHHRAFARCGDFSKLSKEQKTYWQKERAKYVISANQENIDDVFSSAF